MESVDIWYLSLPCLAGVGLGAWGALHPKSQLFGPTVRDAGNACALTFDDGPNPRATPQVLSLLEKYKVQATFFMLGKYVRENPGLAAEIAARKHVIGNHSDTHPNLLFLSRRLIVYELRRCEDSIHTATGLRSSVVRPPFGFRGPQFGSAAREAGFKRIVMWSLSAKDWKSQEWQKISNRLKNVRRGDILLFHDGDHRIANADRTHTLQALDYWLPRWLDSGFSFVSIG